MVRKANSKKKIIIKENKITYTGAELTPAAPVISEAIDVPDIPVKRRLIRISRKLKQKDPESKRETRNLLKSLKILTAIMLGKDKNKELSQALDTDKSFTSKQVKELEDQGLIKKEIEGREVKYSVDKFNLMKFLQGKVIIKWKTERSKTSRVPEKHSFSEKEDKKR